MKRRMSGRGTRAGAARGGTRGSRARRATAAAAGSAEPAPGEEELGSGGESIEEEIEVRTRHERMTRSASSEGGGGGDSTKTTDNGNASSLNPLAEPIILMDGDAQDARQVGAGGKCAALVRMCVARGIGLVVVIGMMQFLDYTTDIYVLGVWLAKAIGGDGVGLDVGPYAESAGIHIHPIIRTMWYGSLAGVACFFMVVSVVASAMLGLAIPGMRKTHRFLLLTPINLHLCHAGWEAVQGHIQFSDFVALKMTETGLESVPLAILMSFALAVGDIAQVEDVFVKCVKASDDGCPTIRGVRTCCGLLNYNDMHDDETYVGNPFEVPYDFRHCGRGEKCMLSLGDATSAPALTCEPMGAESSPGPTNDASVCPEGWFFGGTNTCFHYQGEKLSKAAARAKCASEHSGAANDQDATLARLPRTIHEAVLLRWIPHVGQNGIMHHQTIDMTRARAWVDTTAESVLIDHDPNMVCLVPDFKNGTAAIVGCTLRGKNKDCRVRHRIDVPDGVKAFVHGDNDDEKDRSCHDLCLTVEGCDTWYRHDSCTGPECVCWFERTAVLPDDQFDSNDFDACQVRPLGPSFTEFDVRIGFVPSPEFVETAQGTYGQTIIGSPAFVSSVSLPSICSKPAKPGESFNQILMKLRPCICFGAPH
eukprot:SAG22_NODE_27_length_29018_cov_465.809646_34_plen_649_part_00